MGDTKIQWTGKTWNPIRARNTLTGEVGWFCEHVSPRCDHCYADAMNQNTYFGNGLPYKASSLPSLELFLDEKMLAAPLHWRKPQKVFVCSMTDLFGRFVKDEWIDKIFAVMMMAPQHTFQVLTKRPNRMLQYFQTSETIWENISKTDSQIGERKDDVLNAAFQLFEPSGIRRFNDKEILNRQDEWPLPNVHLGVSCEDQETADERIPLLLQVPAAVRWISAEPLLGPIDFWHDTEIGPMTFLRDDYDLGSEKVNKLDWVVVGGESGPGARSLDLNWIKSIVSQCQTASIPVFVKQLGYRPWWDGIGVGSPGDHIYLEPKTMNGRSGWQFDCMKDRKGGLIDEWPWNLQVRQFPTIGES